MTPAKRSGEGPRRAGREGRGGGFVGGGMVVGGVGGWRVSRWRWIDEGQIDKVGFVRAHGDGLLFLRPLLTRRVLRER